MNYSEILRQGYNQFLLPLGGKKVSTPYRRNEIGSFQKVGPEFQGKSSPEVLAETTQRLAKEQAVNLNKLSIEEIRQFMIKNKLGIDCSGFAYRVLNYLSQEATGKPLTSHGLPNVGRTNVAKLTDPEFANEVNLEDAKPGDMIKLNSAGDVPHVLIIVERKGDKITYIHSSSQTDPEGVHKAQLAIEDNHPVFAEKLGDITFQPKKGDGVRRFKFL